MEAISGWHVLGRQDWKEERVHLAEEDEGESRGESSDVRVAEAPPLGRVPDGTDEERYHQYDVCEHERWLLACQQVRDGLTPRQNCAARGTQQQRELAGLGEQHTYSQCSERRGACEPDPPGPRPRRAGELPPAYGETGQEQGGGRGTREQQEPGGALKGELAGGNGDLDPRGEQVTDSQHPESEAGV